MPRTTKPAPRNEEAPAQTATHHAPSDSAQRSGAQSIDWRGLYRAADAVKALAPWTWMLEDQLFAVQDPGSGELGICSIMGAAGEHLAVAVYLGAAGLAGYRQMMAVRDPDSAHEAFVNQNALQLSFEARDLTDAEDRRVIKSLGLKYRGDMAWPRFRSQRPGYLPWHLTPEEARFEQEVLDQVLVVAPRFRDDPQAMLPPRPEQILCRVRRSGVWEDRWVAPPKPLDPALEAAPVLDELALARLKQSSAAGRRGRWEIDYAVLPSSIKEPGDARPYAALAVMIVEAQSGFVMGIDVIKPADKAGSLVAFVQRTLQTAPMPPERLHVSRDDVRAWLAPLSAALAIPLERRPQLPALRSAKQSLLTSMGG